jgi:septal ring factor EnvC (AmiA/AmiB activator)
MFSADFMRKLEIALASKELAAELVAAIEGGSNASLQAEIEELQADVAALEGDVADTAGAVLALQGSVSDLEQEISDIKDGTTVLPYEPLP